MPPIDSVRAKIHELFFHYSPPIADQDLDIVTDALDAAINAIWDWTSNNMTSLNSGLPQPFRGRATTEQKFLLLCIMASTRTDDLIDLAPKEGE